METPSNLTVRQQSNLTTDPISYEQFITKIRLTIHRISSMWTVTANAEQEVDGILPGLTVTIIVIELYHPLNRERRTLRLHQSGPTGDLQVKYELRHTFIALLDKVLRDPTSKLNKRIDL